jgi:tetratricopeptide (TPR) repeat protein
MLEQPETGENRGVAIVSLKLALSQEARASLAAVRVAQESAQKRARRQTMETRLGVALLLGAAALGAVASAPRLARWRQSGAQAAHALRTSPLAPEAAAAHAAQAAIAVPPAIVVPPAVAVQPAVAVPPAVAAQRVIAAEPAMAEPAAPIAAAPVATPAKVNDSSVPAEGCDTSTRRGLWRRSPEACAQAFAADPTNASLALAVAQGEHAHAHLDEAAQWARRALALDPTAAEAYVIIARADAKNGRADEARAAYQRYLELAPRGWHKAEARAALRRTLGSSR